MARKCQISKVGPQHGHNVSHAKNRTKRQFQVNLQKKRFFDTETKRFYTVKVSARMIKTISKLGFRPALAAYGMSIKDLA